MRCGRTQRLMAAAADGELRPGRQEALDRHLASCEACAREMAATQRMLATVAALPMEAAVPAALEAATLRRIRLAAAGEEERREAQAWWRRFTVPGLALATAAVAVLAIGVARRAGELPVVASLPVRVRPAAPPADAQRSPANVAVPRETAPVASAGPTAERPSDPPPELAAAPDLFIDLPILRNLEKLEHFDAISSLDDPSGGGTGDGSPSSG